MSICCSFNAEEGRTGKKHTGQYTADPIVLITVRDSILKDVDAVDRWPTTDKVTVEAVTCGVTV
jgi:hypothetical protein